MKSTMPHNTNTYPQWIDEYAASVHHAFTNMVPASWAPDGFAVFRMLDGTFLDKLHTAVVAAKQQHIPIVEIIKCFPSPSSFRCAFAFEMWEYQYASIKNTFAQKETFDYLYSIVGQMFTSDWWGYKSNLVHTEGELAVLFGSSAWSIADRAAAQELGKLYASASALVYSLYGDFFPQDSADIYGPYDASKEYGAGAILVIKHFPKLKPAGLWDHLENTAYSDVKVMQVYQGVSFSSEFIGMHSRYDGDIMEGLRAYRVIVDGRELTTIEEIRAVRNAIAEAAARQSVIRGQMSSEDIKNKFITWLAYQYKDFFECVGIDWHPTERMRQMIAGKEIPEKVAYSTK